MSGYSARRSRLEGVAPVDDPGSGRSPVPAEVDRAAVEALFERYVLPEIEVLLRVAHALTRNHADAEDLVQDTLLRAYRAVDRFDGRHPRAWLLTILRNTHVNRNRRRRPELFRDPQLAAAQLMASPSEERTDALVDDQIDADILTAVSRLDDRFRIVVELVDVQGLSQAEAADVLGIPIGTVMSRLHRARGRIRQRLDHLSTTTTPRRPT